MPKEKQKVINELFKEYKRQHSTECTVEYVNKLDLDFKVNAFVFTPEDLKPKKKYNRAKDKRGYQKRIEEELK